MVCGIQATPKWLKFEVPRVNSNERILFGAWVMFYGTSIEADYYRSDRARIRADCKNGINIRRE